MQLHLSMTYGKTTPIYFFKYILLVTKDHSFSTYTKFLEKLTFFTPWYSMYVSFSGGKNVTFSENVAYLLNEWSPIRQMY